MPPAPAPGIANDIGSVTDAAAAWRAHAPALAGWTLQRLLHRTDQWQSYLSRRKQTPDLDHAPSTGELSLKLLARHYAATDPSALVAIAGATTEQAARWLCIAVRRREEGDHESGPPVTPGANFHAMLAWHDKLRSLQFDPILEDTDGAGGYRLVVLFDEPEELARVVAFGQQVVVDYGDLELRQPPTVMGPWLRLPGLHPRRDHHSRVWDGSRWLAGQAAVGRLMEARPTPPQFMRTPRPVMRRRVASPAKPQASSEACEQTKTPEILPTPQEKNMVAPVNPSTTFNAPDPVANMVSAVAERTGLREEEIVNRLFAWFEGQDEVVQAAVLGQIPASIRPDVVRLVLESMARDQAAPIKR